MEKLLGIDEPKHVTPVAIVNGKWTYYNEPVSQLPEHEKQLVFAVIRDAVNFDQDKTNSLKF
jgi:hypothetical protein